MTGSIEMWTRLVTRGHRGQIKVKNPQAPAAKGDRRRKCTLAAPSIGCVREASQAKLARQAIRKQGAAGLMDTD